MRTGGYSTPEERPNSYYPIYYNPNTKHISIDKINGYIEILPVDSEGRHRVWRKTKPSLQKHLDKNEIQVSLKRGSTTEYKVQIIDKIKDGVRPKSVWTGSKYDASTHGTKLLKKIFGESYNFSFPKSLYATQDCIYLAVGDDEEAVILDYFAGSGTTGHAVINLNREDDGNRKYILVEMGEYFNNLTKPRVLKAAYSKGNAPGNAPAVMKP